MFRNGKYYNTHANKTTRILVTDQVCLHLIMERTDDSNRNAGPLLTETTWEVLFANFKDRYEGFDDEDLEFIKGKMIEWETAEKKRIDAFYGARARAAATEAVNTPANLRHVNAQAQGMSLKF